MADVEDKAVRKLYFQQQGAKKKMVLELQNMYIFSAWKEEDMVKLKAFDASGIDGMSWSYEAQTDSMALAPATMTGTEGINRWVVMRARDRAGNLSMPIHVPVGPAGSVTD